MATCDFTATKVCTKCGETKPTSEFHKDKQKFDGLRPSCKACKSRDMAEYRALNPEKGREYAIKWAAANKERKRAANKAWKQANREKVNADAAAWKKRNPDKVKAAELRRYRGNPEKEKARVAAYRKANPEKVKAYFESRRVSMPEAGRVATAAWRARHPERYRELSAKWRADNPGAYRVSNQNRRARLRAVGGRLSRGLADRLYELQGGKCPCCKQPLGENYHMDHIVPLAMGGANVDENIQLLRAECNLQKRAKHPVDFMQSRGFLL